MLQYALVNGALPDKKDRTITISITSASKNFVVTDSSNTFNPYEVNTSDLTAVDLKYRCEVIGTILKNNYPSKDAVVILIDEKAMDQVDEICEINRRLF